MKTTYCLVYQNGIANVFEEMPVTDTRNTSHTGLTVRSERIRLLQDARCICEAYCRGLRKSQMLVRVAWCNDTGDITNSFWHFDKFRNAPYCYDFAKDFVNKQII